MRSATSGNAGTHARLHQQERRSDTADPDDDRWADRRMASPLDTPNGKQHRGERDADQIVRSPAEQELALNRR